MDRIEAPLVVTSDIHLRDPNDSRAVLLEDLIERCIRGQVKHFVLNGDIFDFCFGMSGYFRRKFQRLGKCLERLAASGTEVIFVEGNHEFAFSSMGWKGVRVVVHRDVPLTMPDGRLVRITHGDLLYSDFWYRLLRLITKFPLSHYICSLVPGQWMDRWALKYATHSRGKDDERELDHAAVLRSAASWLQDKQGDVGVFGHFHVPYAEQIANRFLISVDSWDRPSVVMYREGEFYRLFLEDKQLVQKALEPSSYLASV